MEQTEMSPVLELEKQELPEESQAVTEQLLATEEVPAAAESADARLKAVLEALIYITDEPLSAAQIAIAVRQPVEIVTGLLEEIAAEFNKPEHGLTIREVAGGYKMATKPEYHEAIRVFVKNLKPPLKLSLAALETLAVVAYKQPITAPEIMEVRGVQGAGVLKTLLDRKLIATSGRKQVVGKPILYKTTRDFLIQFGLKDLTELPSLKEFEEISRFALSESELDSEMPDAELPDTTMPIAAESPDPPQPEIDPPTMPTPAQDPPSEPLPVQEPVPDPEPLHDPDPHEPGDPQHAPVTEPSTQAKN